MTQRIDKQPRHPYLIHHGKTRIGVYWGADAKQAADSARMESRNFGPTDLTGKKLTVEPFTEEQRQALAKKLNVSN